jgi:YidC/Oxa1 family membrane protein insertase
MMKLYKAHGANPISGCLPLLLQLPVFFALFTVMREFEPDAEPRFGLSAELLQEGARAKIFGAPISAAFNSPGSLRAELDASALVVRLVAAVMVIGMGASTFYTQRQMMARAKGQVMDPQQEMVQKIMLYVLPLSFAVSGVFFPIGVLLYWLTTNVWSMGQQAYVIKRMPPIVPGTGSAGSDNSGDKGKGSSGGPVDLGKRPKGEPTPLTEGSSGSGGTATSTGSVAVASAPSRSQAAAGRAAGSRKNKKKPRGGRR